ncbi:MULTISPECIES: DsbA family protein [unclassified Agarivorans]|uniref:DsbA family protein n=1 Tax=unclassified Agarivorans TaxID=2636026 RepID=UPI0026E373AC|nr:MULTISPECIES: DsbA family protein [unclassified Agarivorans]MDO6687022.1 DsbA family protein [Agarivorans sp. 3_MG-2023]MDO6713566.1 DsbA family protein [Agarivorans sp. 2_MG-2023]MDO6765169.1 DsbA family protein [Agarivorans sp. 1_MG-2023]
MLKQLSSFFIASLFLVSGSAVLSKTAAADFTENRHYTTLKQPASEKPSITLFYTHYCAPCAMVHEPIANIAQKLNIAMVDVPLAVGGPMASEIQLAMAATEHLGVKHQFSQALMKKIHFSAAGAPKTVQELEQVVADCGVNMNDFMSSCQANEVKAKVNTYNQLASDYRIRSTPTIVVNGNKQISMQSLKSFDELEALISHLALQA